jgi:hypothetical protein
VGVTLENDEYAKNNIENTVAAFTLSQYVNDQVRMKDDIYDGGVKIDLPNLLVARLFGPPPP